MMESSLETIGAQFSTRGEDFEKRRSAVAPGNKERKEELQVGGVQVPKLYALQATTPLPSRKADMEGRGALMFTISYSF
jgi:hypothetical protein